MIGALPNYLNLDDPTRNLAGLAAPNWPVGSTYRAIDGTVIGQGIACDPITDEPYLSGLEEMGEGYARLFVPDFIEENRVEFWEAGALPLLVGVGKYITSRNPFVAALWALGAYAAPYPVAAFVAAQGYSRARRYGSVEPLLSKLNPGSLAQEVRSIPRATQRSLSW